MWPGAGSSWWWSAYRGHGDVIIIRDRDFTCILPACIPHSMYISRGLPLKVPRPPSHTYYQPVYLIVCTSPGGLPLKVPRPLYIHTTSLYTS